MARKTGKKAQRDENDQRIKQLVDASTDDFFRCRRCLVNRPKEQLGKLTTVEEFTDGYIKRQRHVCKECCLTEPAEKR